MEFRIQKSTKGAVLLAIAVGALGVGSSANAETRTLKQNTAKDFTNGEFKGPGKGTAYYTAWNMLNGHGYWDTTAGSATDKLESGCDYEIPKGKEFRTPNTSSAIGQFPGDKLTVLDTRIWFYSHYNATLDFNGGLYLKNPGRVYSAVGGVKNVDHSRISHIVGPVYFQNESGNAATFVLDGANNSNVGQSYEGVVSAADTLTISIDPGNPSTTDFSFRNFFWVKFLGDTSAFEAAVSVANKSALFLGANGLPNAGTITVAGDASDPEMSAILGTESAAQGRVSVKSLVLNANARLYLATDEMGAFSSIKVTDAFSVSAPVYIGIDKYPGLNATNRKIEVLRLAGGATGELSESDFRFRGYTGDRASLYVLPAADGLAKFSVATEGDDKVLYMTLDPIVKCVKSQSGAMDWYDEDAWSNNAPLRDDAAYFTDGKSPRHRNSAHNVFGGKSMWITGGSVAQRATNPSVPVEFPRSGLYFVNGIYSAQWGDLATGNQQVGSVSGRVEVLSSPANFLFQVAGNRRKGLKFMGSLVGAEGSGFRASGPTVHDDPITGNPRLAAFLLGFVGDNSEFFGSVSVETNVTFALGSGAFPGSVSIAGCADNLKESGALRTWSATDVCALGSANLASQSIIECQVDAQTGTCGVIEVTDRLQYVAPVQVYLSTFSSKASKGKTLKLPVLRLAEGAEGTLNPADFVFAGFTDKSTSGKREFTVSVENDENGLRTLYLNSPALGLVILIK